MNELQPRDRLVGGVLVFLGVVFLFTVCVGSVMLFNQFTQRRVVTPTTAPLPIILSAPSPTALQVLVVPTAIIPTVIPTAIPTEVIQAVAPASTGMSCKYGPPFINPVATPVPDGGHSQYQDYLCVNGYWYIGIADWVDGSSGDWGSDGFTERGYIMFNSDGSIADRKFTNLQGTAIAGPTK